MIKEESSTMVSKSIYYDEEREYRYFLSRTWDEKQK